MNIDCLLAGNSPDEHGIDGQGGRIALDASVDSLAMRSEFDRLLSPLSSRSFWSAAVTQGSYIPDGGLWAPQRRAVALSLAYIAARRTCAPDAGAALVKMPTGTGKTGVIATLGCAVPAIKKTLVITPRRALVDQMVGDLHSRLWNRFDSIYDGDRVRDRVTTDAAPGTVVPDGPIQRLLPKNAAELAALTSERMVFVGTFAALEQILRPDRPAHRLTGKRPATADEIPPDGDEETPPEQARAALVKLLRSFDLVIVDESHYEPAYIWSQCIRSLGLPTILFSATPYRNDFRYFDIDGRFAFNLSFQEARDQRLIRGVRIHRANSVSAQLPFPEQLISFAAEVDRATSSNAGERARIIVRAETYDKLIEIREQLRKLNQSSVLIHHKESRNDPKSLRFNHATHAFDAPETSNVRFWLHQWKLLEGVDDSRFGGAAIYDAFTSSRAVVQQVGRLLRYSRRDRVETALVMGAEGVGDDLDGRFSRYERYESAFDANPAEALRRETKFVDTLRAASPAVQYIAGDFRNRLDIDNEELGFGDVQLPLRAFVMRNAGGRSIDEIADACALAMGIEDRHEAKVLRPKSVDDPANVRLIPYVAWSNSPLLTQLAMPAWNFGLMALVQAKDWLFLMDTEGLVVDLEALGLEQEQPEILQRLVPTPSATETTRVTVASAVSLDISDMGIRAVTARMRDFGTGFYDLAQGMQATTSVRAILKSADNASSRYLSLQRSSVSDAQRNFATISEYADWIAKLAEKLSSSASPSPAFARFAQALPAPPSDKAKPQNILFDFADLIGEGGEEAPDGWDAEKVKRLASADRCLDVDANGSFEIELDGEKFAGKLKYEITGTVRRRGRYNVTAPTLDAFLVGRAVKSKEKSQLLSGKLNREQAFRVVPADPELIYAQRHFYRPALSLTQIANGVPGGPLEGVTASTWLAAVSSEKGSAKSTTWTSDNIFGGIYAHFGLGALGKPDASLTSAIRSKDAAMADLFDQFSMVVCDDGGTEVCDFLCVDEDRRRVVLVHAKVDDTQMSLNSMQAVGRQAQASLAFLTSVDQSLPDRAATWATAVSIADGSITGRILKPGISPKDALKAAKGALRSARYSREIWILAGKILERQKLIRQLKRSPPSSSARQMVYYIASLQTAAARANVRLRLFCSP